MELEDLQDSTEQWWFILTQNLLSPDLNLYTNILCSKSVEND